MFRARVVRVATAAAAAVSAPMLLRALVAADASSAPERADARVSFPVDASGRSLAPPPPALDPNSWKPFRLSRSEAISADTSRHVFELGAEDVTLGLKPASLLLVKAEIDGKTVVRPYTPVSPADQRGTFELVVKSYENGKISKYLHTLPEGSLVEMKGPIVKFDYVPNQWSAVGMIAGGSGITPMLQLIRAILDNPRDHTQIRLIFANRTPADILLKKELDAMAAVDTRFKVIYVVDKPDDAWKGEKGYITKEMLVSFLPPPQPQSGSHKILVCGPPGMMRLLSGEKKSPAEQGELTGLLADLHYTQDQVFKY